MENDNANLRFAGLGVREPKTYYEAWNLILNREISRMQREAPERAIGSILDEAKGIAHRRTPEEYPNLPEYDWTKQPHSTGKENG